MAERRSGQRGLRQARELDLRTNKPGDPLAAEPTSYALKLTDQSLWLDGFGGTSGQANAWAKQFKDRCTTYVRPLNVYSYRGPGLPYGHQDSWGPIALHAARFLDHLPHAECAVIPIGFSLGCLVAVLGSARHYRDNAPAQPVLPALILVSPFHNDASTLRNGYRLLARERTEASRGLHLAIPPVVAQLAGRRSRERTRLEEAYAALLDQSGTDVHVIYSPRDTFAASVGDHFPFSQHPQLHLHRVDPSERVFAQLGSTPEHEVMYHLHYRVSRSVHERVCEILAQY